MVNVVKYKFKIGAVYYSTQVRYNKEDKLVEVKVYWKCVKRNPDTGYISFVRLLGKHPKITDEGWTVSRKVRNQWDWNDYKHANGHEEIYVGHGNDLWAVTDLIRADCIAEL